MDLTGYWTAVVMEDWRWRMVTPPRGDYASMPLNDEGRRVADSRDPAAEDDSCRVFGAAGVMRMPLRVHITWEDDNTLCVDTDHGMQTRFLHFGPESTEYFDCHSAYDEEWFTVTTIVSDPQYLTQEFITSSSFKRLPDGSSWNPVPCGSG